MAYGFGKALTALDMAGNSGPDYRWLVGAPSSWLDLAMGGSPERPGQKDRVTRERIRALRGHKGLHHASADRDNRRGGTSGANPPPGVTEDIRALVRRAFILADKLTELAIRSGVLEQEPPTIAPRNPRSPSPKVKGRPL